MTEENKTGEGPTTGAFPPRTEADRIAEALKKKILQDKLDELAKEIRARSKKNDGPEMPERFKKVWERVGDPLLESFVRYAHGGEAAENPFPGWTEVAARMSEILSLVRPFATASGATLGAYYSGFYKNLEGSGICPDHALRIIESHNDAVATAFGGFFEAAQEAAKR